MTDLGNIVIKERKGLKSTEKFSWRTLVEVGIHLAYWSFHFTSVNTHWDANWTDHSARDVAQLTVLMFPFICYLNAFWLIPKYLKGNQWGRYLSATVFLLLVLEVFRSLAFVLFNPIEADFETAYFQEFTSRDNLLFGVPNSLLFAILFSMIYRFTRDWITHQKQGNGAEQSPVEKDQVSVTGTSSFRQTLQARRRDSTFLLQVKDIAYLQSQGDFVMAIDREGQSYMLSQTLTVLETWLDPRNFFRINRSEIVNAQAILKFSNHTKDRLAIALKHPEEVLYTSNSRSPEFRKWLETMA